MEPASLQTLVVPVSLLPDSDVFGSMDRGCTLSKFIYKKSIPNDESNMELQMAFFVNKDFEQAMLWLAEKVKEEGVSKGRFRVTGVGGDKYKDLVAETTGLEVEFVDEFVCQQAGALFLVKNFDDDKFCYPDETPVPLNPGEMPDWVHMLMEKVKQNYKDSIGKRIPSVFVFCGSATGINVLNEDNSLEVITASMFGGKSLLGFSKMLLGTNNYDELTELAAKGDRTKVDTQAWEMMSQNEDSEYRSLPPDTVLFPAGKAAEPTAESFNKEDMAAALIGAIVTSTTTLISMACKTTKIAKVYVGGHLFKAKIVRDIFYSSLTMNFAMIGIIKTRFLSNGHTGCLGALVVSRDEALKRRQNMKI